MSQQNLKPLDELKTLDEQVDQVTDLPVLKPIFFRLEEIAKQHPNDFQVQLSVGDVKQHLVNRGSKLKQQPAPPPLAAMPAATPPTPPPAAGPPPMPPAAPPAMPPPMPPKETAAPPPMPVPPKEAAAPPPMPPPSLEKPPEPAAAPPPMPEPLPPPVTPAVRRIVSIPDSSTVRPIFAST